MGEDKNKKIHYSFVHIVNMLKIEHYKLSRRVNGVSDVIINGCKNPFDKQVKPPVIGNEYSFKSVVSYLKTDEETLCYKTNFHDDFIMISYNFISDELKIESSIEDQTLRNILINKMCAQYLIQPKKLPGLIDEVVRKNYNDNFDRDLEDQLLLDIYNLPTSRTVQGVERKRKKA